MRRRIELVLNLKLRIFMRKKKEKEKKIIIETRLIVEGFL